MADPVVARLLDRLEVNAPYVGLVARGYDAWIPVDSLLEEESLYRRLLDPVDGTILELGCGTGRPLLRWLAAGYDVEGIDSSPDMLAMLRAHAAERGLEPTVHLGEMAPLDLGRQFAAIVCPAGSFQLIDDEARAQAALVSYLHHLEPGALIGLTLSAPRPGDEGEMTWHVRRTGTTADGTTIVVDEALTNDHEQHLTILLDRIEAYGQDGRLGETVMRRHHLRWWPKAEFDELLSASGFVDVRSLGRDTGWVATARRPPPTAAH